MKHVAPPLHPSANGVTGVSRDQACEPALPHEQDESSRSQSSATPQQQDLGRQALRNATDGTTDTDLGPVMDKVYNEKVAPDRGPEQPRH